MSKTKEVTEVTEVGVEEAVQALVSDATRRALQDASAAVAAESVPVCVEEVGTVGDATLAGDLAFHGAALSPPITEEAEVKADDFPTWEFPPVVLPTTANARITATLIISVASALPPQNTGIGLSNAGLAVRTPVAPSGEGTTISSLLIEQVGHSLEQMRQIVSVFAGAPTAGVMADTANQAIAARLSAMADKAAVRSNREQFLVRQQAEFNVKFAAETDGVALSIAAVVDDSIAETQQQKVLTAQALVENVWKFAATTRSLGVDLEVVVKVTNQDIAWGIASPVAPSVAGVDVDVLVKNATLAGELVALLAAGQYGYTAASILMPIETYQPAVSVRAIEVKNQAVHFTF